MSSSPSLSSKRRVPVRYRSIALPAEHGAWGFLLEPVLLGLLLAPGVAGLVLSFSMLALFLAQHPFTIALNAYRNGRRTARVVAAERIALLYSLIAFVFFVAVLPYAESVFFIPLLMALPFALIKQYYDLQKQTRAPAAEISGAIALGGIAPSIALLSGWDLIAALLLWLLLSVRSVSSILYVRAKLRGQRGEVVATRSVWLAHIVALLTIISLTISGLIPRLSIPAMLMLVLRMRMGLRDSRSRRARAVGIREMIYGLVYIALIALGFYAGL